MRISPIKDDAQGDLLLHKLGSNVTVQVVLHLLNIDSGTGWNEIGSGILLRENRG